MPEALGAPGQHCRRLARVVHLEAAVSTCYVLMNKAVEANDSSRAYLWFVDKAPPQRPGGSHLSCMQGDGKAAGACPVQGRQPLAPSPKLGVACGN